MKHALGIIVWVTAATCLPRASGATELAANDQSGQSIAEEELRAPQDPTILLRRAWSDTEWNNYEGGRHDIEETLGGLWSWRLSERQDWAVRLKVPYKWHLAGDEPGDSDEHGLGDIKLAVGTAWHLGESWRAGGGVEMRFPTATEDVLGDNVWQPQLFGAVAWDVTRHFSLSPSFEYNQSIAEEDGVDETHFLEMYFPATLVLPRQWSVTARYETKVDFERDDEWTHSGKLVVSKRLEHSPLSFAASIKKSFDGGDKEYQINFTATYFFQ